MTVLELLVREMTVIEFGVIAVAYLIVLACCWAVAAQVTLAAALVIALPRTLAGSDAGVGGLHVPRWADQPRLIADALRWAESGWPYMALVLGLAHQAFGRYADLLYQCEERWGCASLAARAIYRVFSGLTWAVLELRRTPTPTAEPPAGVRERRAETGSGSGTAQAEPAVALRAPQAHEDCDEAPAPHPPLRGSGGRAGDAATVSGHEASEATLRGEPEPPASDGPGAQYITTPQHQTRTRSGAVYPPDVARRAALTIERTLAQRPILVGMLGPLSLTVRVSGGSSMQLSPLALSQQRILAVLAGLPEIKDRERLAHFLWPNSEGKGAKSTRLRSYLMKMRASFRAHLIAADPGCGFAEGERRAGAFLDSGIGYIRLASEEFQTDLQILGLIDWEALNCVDGNPLLSVALWEYAARLVRGVPLQGLDAPLRQSRVAWNTEWIREMRSGTQQELAALLERAIAHALDLGLPEDEFMSALERLGRP